MKLRNLRGLLLPLLLIGAWELASRQDAAGAYAFVPLATIGHALVELLGNGELLVNLLASLARTSAGLALGIVGGVALGALMALSPLANRLVAPLFHALRQVPMLGWIPLIALWLGNGEASKLLIVSLAALYPMVLNTFEGLRQVDVRHREVGQVLALGRWQQLRLVLLPAALPSIATGVLQALAFAWVTAVGSELFLASGAGLGNLMMNAEAGARMEIIVICVLCIGLCGYLMTWLSTLLARRLLRWRPTR
ncbi:ABC transporter permease [Pseudomonas sp. BW16M2]|uniref:ABC transporter permease n=1 Tax=unclassified Pseudomonas TaxID=196821 RepID=UPI001644612B|nr:MULTISPECIES: ABC transporter permease [unclassified Pseudomonas]MBC3437900.1 ABC transporter permease [Pseudomonas sp. BW16M2]MCP8635776.1 ABC transporter permease [Pseudomonas sp. DVZ6]MDD7786265.1 ABC transporter permease [Pseudomonas sp. DVZ24]